MKMIFFFLTLIQESPSLDTIIDKLNSIEESGKYFGNYTIIDVIISIIGLIISIGILFGIIYKIFKYMKVKEVLLILPLSKEEIQKFEFWKQFRTTILEKSHDYKLRIVPKCPVESFDDISQNKLIDNELKGRSYDAVILCPVKETNISNEKIYRYIQRERIVFHDSSWMKIVEKYSQLRMNYPFFVSVNNFDGGKIAAKIMYSYFDYKKIADKKLNILIIPGKSENKNHSNERIDGFISELTPKAGSNIQYSIAPDCNWRKEETIEVLKEFYDKKLSVLNEDINGIFACNDEMAMGVIELIYKDKPDKLNNSIIIGFDNTDNIKHMLDSQQYNNFIGTVDAKVSDQADKVLFYLQMLTNERKGLKRFQRNRRLFDGLIEPEHYINSKYKTLKIE